MFLPLIFLFGVLLGSFGNVLIVRLPETRSIKGRSLCPACGRTIRFYDLIPVISFLVLRARCRACKARISWQYPLVELSSGLLFALAFLLPSPSLFHSLVVAFCLWLLLLIAVTDARAMLIPDALNIPFLLLSLYHAHLLGTHALLPAVLGGGFFAIQWIISRGKFVGSGDIILAAGIGAFLGDEYLLLLAMSFAYVLGAIIAGGLLLSGLKKRESHIALAPFLIVGTLVVFLWGEQILALM